MGLFSISMRKKAKPIRPISEDLDVPPAPPPMRGKEMPALESEGEHIQIPPPPKKKELHKFPSPFSRRPKEIPLPPEKAPEIPSPKEMLRREEIGPSVPPAPTKKGMPMFPEIPKEEHAPEGEAFVLPEKVAPPTEERMPIVSRLTDLDVTKPIFVGINEFKTTLKEMSHLRAKLKDATTSIERISDIQNEKDKHLDDWKVSLENIQEKLVYVDKSLFTG